ncbi:hypothetical protein B0H15DRAFT_742123, partial [Mycena belliarum]
SQGKALPTKGRPAAVAWWIGRARARDPPVTEVDVKRFSSDFVTWWRGMNPAWRRDGPLLQDEGGDLAVMKTSGINGFLSVLMALKWWRRALTGSASAEEWAACVDDVVWVLRQMAGQRDGATRE